MADALAHERLHIISSNQRRGHSVGWRFNKTGSLAIGSQQRFNLAAQGVIAAAGLIDERGPPFGRTFERRLEQLIYLLPTLRLHRTFHPPASGAATPWPRAIRAAPSVKRCPALRPSLPGSARQKNAARRSGPCARPSPSASQGPRRLPAIQRRAPQSL